MYVCMYVPVHPYLACYQTLRGSSAGVEEEYGRLMPRASIAVAMVLAVYIPPQAPGPIEYKVMITL